MTGDGPHISKRRSDTGHSLHSLTAVVGGLGQSGCRRFHQARAIQAIYYFAVQAYGLETKYHLGCRCRLRRVSGRSVVLITYQISDIALLKRSSEIDNWMQIQSRQRDTVYTRPITYNIDGEQLARLFVPRQQSLIRANRETYPPRVVMSVGRSMG